MAKVIINAKLSKHDKMLPAGIALSIKGKRDIGVIDKRQITYKDQNVFYCGIEWDDTKRLLTLNNEGMSNNANIGIFVSTYPVDVVEGTMFIHEEFNMGTEVGSVCYKRDIGGYDYNRRDDEFIEKIDEGLYGIKPKDVNLFIVVGTAKEKFIVKNKEGFYFVCDFKKNNWFVLKPGSSEIDIYDYNNDIQLRDILKNKLPFPGLDRKLFEGSNVLKIENQTFDINKHALQNV